MALQVGLQREVFIIIDGPNVAGARAAALPQHPRDDAGAVWECAQYFKQRNATTVKIYGPRGWIDAQPRLIQLRNAGLLFATPGGLDDKFMLQAADERGAFLVSNDRFLDHMEFSQEWVRFHRVPFMYEPQFCAERGALERIALFERWESDPAFDAGMAITVRASANAPPAAGALGAIGMSPQQPQPQSNFPQQHFLEQQLAHTSPS